MYWKIFNWAKDVMLNPKKNTKKDFGYNEFTNRLMIVSLISGVASVIIGLFISGFGVSVISALFMVSTFLFIALVSPFINGAVAHFFGKIVFRLMKRDFKRTYNAYAYMEVPFLVFAWVPFVGLIIGGIWSIVVGVSALSNQQKISKWRALAVILIPTLILMVIILALFGLLMHSMMVTFGPEIVESVFSGLNSENVAGLV